MKIVIQTPAEGEEEQIIIKCHQMDEQLLSIVTQLKAVESNLIAHHNGSIFQLTYSDIFYFEAVDSKTFAYTEKTVYQVNLKLYEIEKKYQFNRFVRISKSVVVNLKHIDNISPAFSGRFEAHMKNGERVIISRNYVPEFKKQLGIL